MALEPALIGSANQLNERPVLTIRFGAVNGGKVSDSNLRVAAVIQLPHTACLLLSGAFVLEVRSRSIS